MPRITIRFTVDSRDGSLRVNCQTLLREIPWCIDGRSHY